LHAYACYSGKVINLEKKQGKKDLPARQQLEAKWRGRLGAAHEG